MPVEKLQRFENSSILKETVIEEIKYVCPSAEQMSRFTFDLAQEIESSGQRFDRVVALAKGGVTWSRQLVDYVGMRDDVLSFVTISRYKGTEETNDLKIIEPLPRRVDGEKILLFDEVIDGGDTIIKAHEHVFDKGAKDIKIATLCYKPRSSVVPDFFAFKTDAWVAFPHDRREFIEDKVRAWRKSGADLGLIRRRLTEIGLPAYEINAFLPKAWQVTS